MKRLPHAIALLLLLGGAAHAKGSSLSAALNRIMAASAHGFGSLRGEVKLRDAHGTPVVWRSKVKLPFPNETFVNQVAPIHRAFVDAIVLTTKSPEQSRKVYDQLIREVRAALPAKVWQQRPGKATDGSRWFTSFQRARGRLSVRVTEGRVRDQHIVYVGVYEQTR